MDNYSLEEVKMLMNKNLVTPEVLNNILKSTTRRLELYNDKDDLAILQYLSKSNLVPDEAKEDINKYLAIYNDYNVKANDNVIQSKEERKPSVIIVFSIIVFLLVLCVLLLLNKG
jgi:hypothetical protein